MSIPQNTASPDSTLKSRSPVRPMKSKPSPVSNSTMSGNNPRKGALPPKRAPLGEIRPQNPPVQEQSQPRKLGRPSSKPILDWFQRKLGGTARTRRASDVSRGRVANVDHGPSPRDKRRPVLSDGFRELTRVQSTPSRGRSSADREMRRLSQVVPSTLSSRPTGISTSTNDATSILDDSEGRGDVSTYRSSYARDSMWSPTSNLEADEDASLRPLPPSSPPSPSPSRSSSSYLSNSRTFQSMAASTKPTTLLSVDLAGGMAHIAQAPPTPGTASRVPAHLWSNLSGSGGGSISFSALPPSPSSSYSTSIRLDSTHPVQAPQHTTHHPRNNPRPSSPPLDNASVLTLASSAFGIPGARMGILGGTNDATSFTHFSQFGGSRLVAEDRSSHFILGDDLDVEGDRDVNASVRALRPRSSRRGSWESEASGWSARLGNGGTTGLSPGVPAPVREKSLRSLSVKTGQMSVGGNENEDDDESLDRSESPKVTSEKLHG
ncbi:hypothetical protein B0F90DRAFT_1814145 [Multifurca ochricompacta]|uniref:Uncharacterized protein n=1 Tax=Multifurca ochricompacta TaxID=376703 RepID=A0AAD4MCK2_9AGAM|nr:hypothetical protein B0F90DRAFT_1814145 [Multifurca ochricompacta]